MDTERLESELKRVIEEDGLREDDHGFYHPSEVTGCPLKVHLNKMTENETVLNSWLFQGSAVHHYLQETGILDEALHDSGYHLMDTHYEVHTVKEIGEGVYLTGTCDILCETEGARTIFDIKYSSIPVESGHDRLFKYFSQANTYAYMFDADEYGLMMINSKSRDLLDDIHVLEGEPSEENWELVKEKAMSIHEALEDAGHTDNVVWDPDELEADMDGFWGEVMDHFDTDHIPAYDGECKYCDHSDYCPVKNGTLDGGLRSFVNGS